MWQGRVDLSQAAGRAERGRWKGRAAWRRRRRGRVRPCGARWPRTRVWLSVLITREPLGAAQSEETVPETGLAAKPAASPGVPVPPKVEPSAGMTQNSLRAVKFMVHFRDGCRPTSAGRGRQAVGSREAGDAEPGLCHLPRLSV